ncbi:MAG: gliding motility protein GldM [Siphonobacter sp.]
MAGAKETPRQRMIGMMYLVLTAMLALQVSSALIDKFILLNRSLESANGTSSITNQQSVKGIKDKAAESGNLYADVVQKADAVRKLSVDMYNELDALKSEIVQKGGGYDEQGNLKEPKEEEQVAVLMVGNNRTGKAYALKDRLNKFVVDLQKFADPGTQFAPLALDAKDDPVTSRDPEQRRKDFAELNFAQTPIPAALSVLSQKQSEILRYENTVLDQLAAKVGLKEIKFDKIFPVVSAKSNTVVAGMKYEAEMYVAATSNAITPRMSFNGAAVPIKDGRGQIQFIAQGGAYGPDGLAKKSYTATINYPDPSGQMKTFTVTGEYFVAKPSYSIQSASLPALYLGCANRLQFVSPQMGAMWNPSFNAEGAETIAGGQGKVTVVPSSRTVSLNVVNMGTTLGTEKFNVRRVPAPKLVAYGNGSQLDTRKGAGASQLRVLEVKAVADEDFAASNPEDAKFRISDAQISLARGQKRVAGPVSLGNISSMAATAQAGDRYVIEVKGYQRQNFQGKVSSTALNEIITIPLY